MHYLRSKYQATRDLPGSPRQIEPYKKILVCHTAVEDTHYKQYANAYGRPFQLLRLKFLAPPREKPSILFRHLHGEKV